MKVNLGYLGLLLGLSGCVLGPDYHEPTPAIPANWQAEQGTDLQRIAPEDLKKWWQKFADPQLDNLMTQALQNNFDLKIALTRVEQSRSERSASHAELFPSLSLSASPQRNVNPFPGLAPGLRYNQFQLGFDAVWEIDLFGRLQRRAEAADANLDVAAEQYSQALVVLTADLARHYIEYRSLQNQLRIIRSNLAAQQHTLALTEKLFKEGIATRTDLSRLRAQTQTIAAQIPDLEAGIAGRLSQIEILLGKAPGELAGSLQQTAAIPSAPGREILSSPADILRQRPDLRVAERQLAAATAMQGAAMAEMYPKISLSAFLGMRNTDLDTLFKSAAFSYTTGANLVQPLLNFGRIRAGIDMAKAQHSEAYLGYEKAVLEALQETETAMTRYLQEEIRRQTLVVSVADLQETVHLSERRYQQGVAALLEVLEAQRELYAGQIQLSQSEAATATYLIAVYKALGGAGGHEEAPKHQAAITSTAAADPAVYR